ncbi:MAG: thymidylate synthase [Candidatus Poribacteria bacterium]|nr:thymidylate synthase [Candidatus Poribacteria bacterium]
MKQTIADMREIFCNQDQIKPKGEMLEIMSASFRCPEYETSLFGQFNPDYFRRELTWFLSLSDNLHDMYPDGDFPRAWANVASPKGKTNSNHAIPVLSSPKGRLSQFQHCLNQLLEDPKTRRAVMIYLEPEMHDLYKAEGMNDFKCTWGAQVFIRGGYMSYHVSMRSNDAVIGFRNDLAWHRYMHQLILDAYNAIIEHREGKTPVRLGELHWYAGTLHVYPYHRHLVRKEWA